MQWYTAFNIFSSLTLSLSLHIYEGQLKSLSAEDIFIECDQMRFIFQYSSPQAVYTLLPSVLVKKVINSRYNVIIRTFQPTHINRWSDNQIGKKTDSHQVPLTVSMLL